ncbi:hypothetical protein LWF15_33885 [Kineosporia rhizophila]|uniref:hypothetical protein n=1 Tax=Kineosporia rhizophila TaxID=84633 RepID=UPI001E4A3777|nr:hypothetical protein [Kineosporia rhizophila]MCE0540498.1 hypothetical protein [Kineosporia rhizophila]
MREPVSSIVFEIRRLARDFPGSSLPPEIVPTSGAFDVLDVSKAAVLRLSAAERQVLGLAAQGYSVSQISRLTASTLRQTRARLDFAGAHLGLSPGLLAAFGTAEPSGDSVSRA